MFPTNDRDTYYYLQCSSFSGCFDSTLRWQRRRSDGSDPRHRRSSAHDSQRPGIEFPGNNETRRSELSKAILPRFDFEEMAKRSLGAERRRTAAEQNEFTRLFADLLKDSYIDSIEAYRSEKVFTIEVKPRTAITPMSALK